MIQFQFSDSLIFNCFELLKFKLRKSPSFKNVYIASNTRIEKWVPVFNLKTHQFEKLEQVEAFDTENPIKRILFNEKANIIICSNNNSIRILDSHTFEIKKILETTRLIFCIEWYEKQGKQFLIVGYNNGVDLLDLELELVQNIQPQKFAYYDMTHLVVNEQDELLCGNFNGETSMYCLNDFSRKKTFQFGVYTISGLCHLAGENENLFAVSILDWKSLENDKIKIWDEYTGEYSLDQKVPKSHGICGLLYSRELNVLISCGHDENICVWKLNNIGSDCEKTIILELDFQIKVSLGFNKRMKFLNTKNQTQILVVDEIEEQEIGLCETFLRIIDLTTRRIVWGMKRSEFSHIIDIFIQ